MKDNFVLKIVLTSNKKIFILHYLKLLNNILHGCSSKIFNLKLWTKRKMFWMYIGIMVFIWWTLFRDKNVFVMFRVSPSANCKLDTSGIKLIMWNCNKTTNTYLPKKQLILDKFNFAYYNFSHVCWLCFKIK